MMPVGEWRYSFTYPQPLNEMWVRVYLPHQLLYTPIKAPIILF
jgi:hypothetical protein